jgi:S1-C subfamily serine protease
MRFRDSNIEVAQLVNPPTDFDGVLLDRAGDVTALWSSFAYENGREIAQDNRAVPIGLVSEMLAVVKSGQPLRSLEVELAPQPLSKSRELGLSDEWLKKLEQHSPTRRQALAIVRIVGGAPAKGVLQQGDVLLAVDGQVVSRFREVERAVAGKETVQVTVWRGDSAKTLDVRTAALSGNDIDRVVMWGGATLQAPHRAMSAQRAIPPVGVYVGYFAYGSPATRYGLYPTRRIVEVDGVPTPNLDAFLKVVTGKPDRASVRLRTLTWNDAPEVITLKLDKHYWPAYELVRTPTGWERRTLE